MTIQTPNIQAEWRYADKRRDDLNGSSGFTLVCSDEHKQLSPNIQWRNNIVNRIIQKPKNSSHLNPLNHRRMLCN